ncbi:MAG: hypothetical protein MJ252_21510 [archaeon]|nr:hypothetical protein [archaeon]
MDTSTNSTKFEFGLDMAELEKRTDEKYINTKKYLTCDAPEYLELAEGDKKALVFLVKSGAILEKIHYRIDCIHNIPFKAFLEEEIKKGNKQAELTKILFDAQKGVHALDRLSNKIHLIKGTEEMPGKGVYPEDLSKEEFHSIIKKMLEENKVEEVKNILNQRSMVLREGKELKSIDYVDFFKEDFAKMADLLEEAAKVSTNKDFNEYLELQAKAFRKADPMLDAYADKKWAELQDTPLEYTITRENYEDELTSTVNENEELKNILKEKGINPVPKDFLGCRVGIVNKKGTEALVAIKKYLPELAKNMPYNNEYEQNIKSDKESKQTMVDVDMIMCAGDIGAYRAGITLAENLPNDDKLSLTIGGGRRNVFHRQIRFISNITKLQERLDTLLDKEQHKYYNNEADHWFTIGHENTHSLGPKKANDKLGKYSHIIEENKADMGGLGFVDLLTELGMYTKEQRDQIIVTAITDNFLKTKPTLSQAHRVRTVMQNYYIFKRGGYEIKDGVIHVNIDKVVPAAKEMLAEIVRVQVDDDFAKAEKYVMDNFVWTDEMELIGQKLQKISLELNGRLETELADKLLTQ